MKIKKLKILKFFIVVSLLFGCVSDQYADDSVLEKIGIGLAIQGGGYVIIKGIEFIYFKLTHNEDQEFIDNQKKAFALGNINPDDPSAQILIRRSRTSYILATLDEQKKFHEKNEKNPSTKEKLLKSIERDKQKILNAEDSDENNSSSTESISSQTYATA